MKKPVFSGVMPVKGPRPYMEEALASLSAQSMGDDLEVIVQDGTSECTNNTKIPQGLNVRWCHEEDGGQSDALNKGFSKAQGEWFFWLNADDVLLPGALRRIEREMQGGADVVWIAGNMAVIDEKAHVVQCFRDRGRRCDYLAKPVRVYGPSSFFRRELLDRVGGFDASLRYCMDTDLWCRFRDAGYWFSKANRYIFGFRRHAGSTTMGEKPPGEQSRQDAEVASMHVRRNVVMSAWDTRMSQFHRLVDGSYALGLFDTIRYRGKNCMTCLGDAP